MDKSWRIYIDTGGTFTDCICYDPSNNISRIKILSDSSICLEINQQISPSEYKVRGFNPDYYPFLNTYKAKSGSKQFSIKHLSTDGILELNEAIHLELGDQIKIVSSEQAPVFACRLLTKTNIHECLPEIKLAIGTTIATNALLEKRPKPIIAIHSKGFKDLLKIGDQRRPNIFQLDIPAKTILTEHVFDYSEEEDLEAFLLNAQRNVKLNKNTPIAISLKNAYKDESKEHKLKNFLQSQGFQSVQCGSTLSQEIGYLERTQATHVNAYLSPLMDQFTNEISQNITDLKIMRSDGDLSEHHNFKPIDGLLSGPAAGLKAIAHLSNEYNVEKLIGLDMGGTSADVCRYDGKFDYLYSTKVGSFELYSKSLEIHTVAAGGGSICDYKKGQLTVGPESAGAFPGPSSYGHGGPLCITDVNLLLNKLHPSQFSIPIFREKAEMALIDLKNKIESEGTKISTNELLTGLNQLANAKMAAAIEKISIEKGFKLDEYTLIGYGGAGGLHTCEVAELLNIHKIIIPYNAGILCAQGIEHTKESFQQSSLILKSLDEVLPQLDAQLATLKQVCKNKLNTKEEIQFELVYRMRLEGQDYCLQLVNIQPEDLEFEFRKQYKNLYGHSPEGRTIELFSIDVKGFEKEKNKLNKRHEYSFSPAVISDSTFVEWDHLKIDTPYKGNLSISHPHCGVYVPSKWAVIQNNHRDLILQRNKTTPVDSTDEKHELTNDSLFSNRLSAIAHEMGSLLQRTSFSVNIKERLDFSCAILDRNGDLLVNAPHIPVHLGSLGHCAKKILNKLSFEEGDVVITNHPKYGGSHLPDITLMKGVFNESKEIIGYVMNRAHHAEIGGLSPGSMPPQAKNLEEEGVAFTPMFLVKSGRILMKTITDMLSNAKYPSRQINHNQLDLEAALAALKHGENAIAKLFKIHGMKSSLNFMDNILIRGNKACQKLIMQYHGQILHAEEELDNGLKIKLKILFDQPTITFDFHGTCLPDSGNLNANDSIVHSAIMYVLRILIDEEIPLNDGIMKNVKIKIPNCFLHPKFEDDPALCPAVVGGNTETSQRLVDCLLKPFGIVACSQGTMNNFLFGNDQFGYYETICGGTGAGVSFHGQHAVHQHMTNTKITDPEIMEQRYPVRLLEFSIREKSGGQGKYCGGNGVRRRIEFLEDLKLTILSQHRTIAPYALNGGHSGKTGHQFITNQNGQKIPLHGSEQINVRKGDILCIETPGGGGYGISET